MLPRLPTWNTCDGYTPLRLNNYRKVGTACYELDVACTKQYRLSRGIVWHAASAGGWRPKRLSVTTPTLQAHTLRVYTGQRSEKLFRGGDRRFLARFHTLHCAGYPEKQPQRRAHRDNVDGVRCHVMVEQAALGAAVQHNRILSNCLP